MALWPDTATPSCSTFSSLLCRLVICWSFQFSCKQAPSFLWLYSLSQFLKQFYAEIDGEHGADRDLRYVFGGIAVL